MALHREAGNRVAYTSYEAAPALYLSETEENSRFGSEYLEVN